MIHCIKIKDKNRTTISYLNDLKEFPEVINFKEGKNIIIGENGSGKTTLMNLLRDYTMCNPDKTNINTKNYYLHKFFDERGLLDEKEENLLDGVDVKANYDIKYHYLVENYGKSDISEMEVLMKTFSTTNKSMGEMLKTRTSILLQESFQDSRAEYKFTEILNKLKLGVNSLWGERLDELVKYYSKNNIKEDVSIFTVLLDEPDRNLDIYGLEELYPVLSYPKERNQVIAVIHNIALIYKLSKLKNINFIEMTPGYLDRVKNI